MVETVCWMRVAEEKTMSAPRRRIHRQSGEKDEKAKVKVKGSVSVQG